MNASAAVLFQQLPHRPVPVVENPNFSDQYPADQHRDDQGNNHVSAHGLLRLPVPDRLPRCNAGEQHAYKKKDERAHTAEDYESHSRRRSEIAPTPFSGSMHLVEACDKGAIVAVPRGDYRLTLYRIDYEALEREEMSWTGATEVIVLTRGGVKKDDVAGLLPFEERTDHS